MKLANIMIAGTAALTIVSSSAVAQQVVITGIGDGCDPVAHAFDADHIGAEVAEDHRGVGPGADAS